MCMPNIGPGECRRRLRIGVLFGVVTAFVGGAVAFAHGARAWRLVVAVPAWLAAVGVFQALEKTWVGLAARGLRDLDTGPHVIADVAELAQVRRQARQVYARATLAALLATALYVAL
jgi:hypothetical protein